MPRRTPIGERISRAYFPRHQQSLRDLTGKAFLFWRDLPLGIMPMRGRRDRAEYNARLDPESATEEEAFIKLLDIGQFKRRTLPEAVVEFVEQVARDVGYRGEAYYEIVRAESDGPLELAGLPPMALKRGRGHYTQAIPEADRGPTDPAAISIPTDRIWHAKLPEPLGSPAEHRAMLAELSEQEPVPKFALASQQLGTESGYEFSSHLRATNIAVERATRRWGTIPSLRQIS